MPIQWSTRSPLPQTRLPAGQGRATVVLDPSAQRGRQRRRSSCFRRAGPSACAWRDCRPDDNRGYPDRLPWRTRALRGRRRRTYHSRSQRVARPREAGALRILRKATEFDRSPPGFGCGCIAEDGRMDERLDTFPRLLLHHARTRPDAPATREKDLGIWQTWTWRQVADEVRALACGLAAQGFRRGMHLAIIGDNRPRLYWAMIAAQALGGVAGADVPGRARRRVRLRAERRRDRLRDRRGPGAGRQAARGAGRRSRRSRTSTTTIRAACATTSGVTSFERLLELGREFDRAHPGFYDEEVAQGRADDVSVMLYTSGTTGKPKGVCQTHARVHRRGDGRRRVRPPDGRRQTSCPTCRWPGSATTCSPTRRRWYAGFTINCPESGDTVMTDLREIGPTYYFAPPRVFENLLTQVMIRMEDAGAHQARAVPALHRRRAALRRRDPRRQAGARWATGCSTRSATCWSTAPLRNVLGMSRIRVAYTAGAAIGPDLFRFYRSIGINLKQLYGSTETCAYVCLQPDGGVQARHRRHAGAGRRGEDRRQRRGAGARADAAQGVLQAARRDRRVDRRRRLLPHRRRRLLRRRAASCKIIDRAKDVGKLAGGAMFAPNYIENKLKFFPHIKEAVAFGDGRDHGLRVHQHRHGIGRQLGRAARPRRTRATPTSPQKPEVYALIRECVEQVNAELARRSPGSPTRRSTAS